MVLGVGSVSALVVGCEGNGAAQWWLGWPACVSQAGRQVQGTSRGRTPHTCCPALALEGTPVWALPGPALGAAAAPAAVAAGMHTEARPRSAPAAEHAAAAGVPLQLLLVVREAMRDGERLRTLLVGAAAAARQTMTCPRAAAVQVADRLLGLPRAQQHIFGVNEAIH